MERKNNLARMATILTAVLIISMPFYVSDVYAQSLSVVRNSGESEVDGFIRGIDDVWTLQVEASIPGSSVTPQQLIINDDPRFDFDTCSQTVGGYICTYQYDYSGGDLGPERTYPMSIALYSSGLGQVLEREDTSVTVDSSAPEISNLAIVQSGGTTRATMLVSERPDNCAGLDKVEIYDGETNTLLKTASLAPMVSEQCGQNSITVTDIVFPATGSTTKTGRVQVYDKLGHFGTATDGLSYDYSEPQVIAGTLRVGELSDYVALGSVTENVSIQIIEDGDFLSVIGTSFEWGWSEELANCVKTDLEEDIFTCVWEDMSFQLGGSVNLQLEISDGAHDLTETISKTFTIDSTAPLLTFFGTKSFEGTSYSNPGFNTVRAIFEESGSGMDLGSVRADLHELDPFKAVSYPANNCTSSGSTWTCFWNRVENKLDYSPAEIYLVNAEDKAGNAVTSGPTTARLNLDDVVPVISTIDVSAIGADGLVSFYKSHDLLKISFIVEEAHGVEGWVDLSGVVNNFPVGFEHENKVVKATCDEIEDEVYECAAYTPRIKSGASLGEIRIRAVDFAGNEAEAAETIEIQAIAQEINPDYWFVDDVRASPSAIDIDVVKLVPQKMFYAIDLGTTDPSVEINGVGVGACDGDTSKLETKYVVNSLPGVRTPYLVLELKPFTGDVGVLNYNCTLKIFSRKGDTALAYAEDENVSLEVNFYKSELGAEFDALAGKIWRARHNARTGFYGAIGAMKDILKWAQIICQGLYIIDKLRVGLNVLTGKTDTLRSTQYGQPAATAICGSTVATDEFYEEEIVQPLKFACDIATCRNDFGLDKIHEMANPYKAIGISIDKYASIWSSIYTMCLPGLVYNLEKLRQIECRYVYCLEEEVKSGLATIDACRQLKEYETCKYVYTEMFWLLNPFQPIVDEIFDTVRSLMTDPVGLFEIAVLNLPCALSCAFSGESEVLCEIAAWSSYILDITQDVIGLYETQQSIRKNYCSEIDADRI